MNRSVYLVALMSISSCFTIFCAHSSKPTFGGPRSAFRRTTSALNSAIEKTTAAPDAARPVTPPPVAPQTNRFPIQPRSTQQATQAAYNLFLAPNSSTKPVINAAEARIFLEGI